MAEHEHDDQVPMVPVEDMPPWTKYEVILTRKADGDVRRQDFVNIEEAAGMFQHYLSAHGEEFDVTPLVIVRRPLNGLRRPSSWLWSMRSRLRRPSTTTTITTISPWTMRSVDELSVRVTRHRLPGLP
jgi:hypothetical protein